MTVQEVLADGELAKAVRLQTRAVAAAPTPAGQLQLAELHLVAGDMRSAWDTLASIQSDDPAWSASRRGWRDLIRAAKRRDEGRRSLHPLSVDLPPHAKYRLRLAASLGAGSQQLASRYADAADEASPELHGHADGQEFVGLRDLDDRFASVLEAFFGKAYVVVPLERLDRIRLLPVVGVADTVYRPAELRSTDGEVWPCVLPLVYPRSHASGGEYALGYLTDCPDESSVSAVAVGARVWYFGENEGPLSECRQIDLRLG